MTPTDFLAVYGSLLATALAGWDIAKYVLDRPRLRVRCYLGKILQQGDGLRDRDQPRVLVYSIANSGGKPIVVTSAGGASSDGSFFMVMGSVDLPRTLQPGESLTITGPVPKDIQAIKHFSVWDALGRHWKASTDGVRKQLAEQPAAAVVPEDKG